MSDLVERLRKYAPHATRPSVAVIMDEAATHITTIEADLAEMTRRRDGWKAKAEGFDTIRHALREKVGAPWPPSLSRALWAGLAADEKLRADEAEAEKAALVAEVERLRVALHEIDLEASNTIPPDGGDAAFGALDAILRIINPFRIERTAHDQ